MFCKLEDNKLILDLKNRKNEFLKNNAFLESQNNGKYKIKDEFFKKVSGRFLKEEKENVVDIVILLESPHKKEYEYEYLNNKVVKITPIGSARGHTGEKISRNLDKIKELSRKILKIENRDYNFYILNPVPYQTSLHAIIGSKRINKSLRDKVFIEIFANNFKNCKTEFIDELEKKTPKLILNCCTKNLKELVEKEILNQLKNKDIKVFSNLYHPSARRFKDKLNEEIEQLNNLEGKA